MPSDNNQEILVKYAMGSPENMRVACEIYNSFGEIVKRAVSRFVDDLSHAIKVKLGDEWELELDDKKDMLEQYWGFSIIKKGWAGIKISVEMQRSLMRSCIYGVGRDDLLPEGSIREALNHKKQGKCSESWAWYQSFDYPFYNWSDDDFLIKVVKDDERNKMVQDMTEIISQIREVVESEMKKGT